MRFCYVRARCSHVSLYTFDGSPRLCLNVKGHLQLLKVTETKLSNYVKDHTYTLFNSSYWVSSSLSLFLSTHFPLPPTFSLSLTHTERELWMCPCQRDTPRVLASKIKCESPTPSLSPLKYLLISYNLTKGSQPMIAVNFKVY